MFGQAPAYNGTGGMAMWFVTLLLLAAGGFLLVRMGLSLTAVSRYSFRNRSVQRKRISAFLFGFLGIIFVVFSVYLFVG
jgi:hypothetical protein